MPLPFFNSEDEHLGSLTGLCVQETLAVCFHYPLENFSYVHHVFLLCRPSNQHEVDS